ncbi:MAG: phosphopantetheine-binding protein, partial [Bacilli bacterium]|nr:phosphopantetheine-binding protein [Bacilli bacterium]
KGSIGAPLTNIEYKIKDKELCVKTPQIHSYRLINGNEVPAELDDEGYFHTGDIGVLDETGHAWLKGKMKDVVIGANGENIYPDEIAIRFNGLPFVNKYTVLGINEGHDEVLTLVLSLDRELNEDEKSGLSKAISKINDTFPNSLKVRKVLLSKEDLPVNTSMKIVKHVLIEKYDANKDSFEELSIVSNVTFDAFDANEVKDVQERVKKIVAMVFGMKPEDIGVSQNLITDLGGDSFVYMTLLAELENEFKLSVPGELIGTLNTVNDFALFVLKNK